MIEVSLRWCTGWVMAEVGIRLCEKDFMLCVGKYLLHTYVRFYQVYLDFGGATYYINLGIKAS